MKSENWASFRARTKERVRRLDRNALEMAHIYLKEVKICPIFVQTGRC